MKYLFFDIECSNCFSNKNKICEFGYVLTDENFNVLRKEAIPMSPGDKRNREDRFDESIYKREPDFQWAYDYDFYFECPKFPHYYEKIKKLIEEEDTMVFGYSVDNDIRYLESEFKRYKLDYFNYKVCDVQRIMNYYSKEKEKVKGLKNTFLKLCPATERTMVQSHLSRDDAYMSMRILQEMLKNLDVSVKEIIELCPDAYYDANEYLVKYHRRQQEKKKFGNKKAANENQVIWEEFYRSYLEQLEKEESKGKLYTISSTIKIEKNILLDVINFIQTNDYVACDKVKDSNYIIALDQEDKERLLSVLKQPYTGEFVLYSDIKNAVLN